jgi:hypothetical protein
VAHARQPGCSAEWHGFGLFLFALDYATNWREAHRWIIWLLPLAGFVVGWIYLKWQQRGGGE